MSLSAAFEAKFGLLLRSVGNALEKLNSASALV